MIYTRQDYKINAIRCPPRSGSTHFCNMLANTRLAGEPKEFFNSGAAERLGKRFKLTDISTTGISRSLHLTTKDNNVIGIKIIGSCGAKSSDQWRRFADSGTIVDSWIRIYRRDKVLQAISLYKANMQEYWGVNKNNENKDKEVEYSYEEIEDRLIKILNIDNDLNNWFLDKPCLSIEYESDILDKPEETVYKTLDYLGIEYDKPLDIKSDIKILRNEDSYEMKERFILDSRGKYDIYKNS